MPPSLRPWTKYELRQDRHRCRMLYLSERNTLVNAVKRFKAEIKTIRAKIKLMQTETKAIQAKTKVIEAQTKAKEAEIATAQEKTRRLRMRLRQAGVK